MSNLNVINLVGRVGADPDLRYFESGTVLCKLSLAVDRRTGKKDEPPNWFPLELWAKTAEVAANYVRSGSLIGVEGSLKLESWTDRNTGVTRVKPVVKVDRLELLASKRDENSSPTADPVFAPDPVPSSVTNGFTAPNQF